MQSDVQLLLKLSDLVRCLERAELFGKLSAYRHIGASVGSIQLKTTMMDPPPSYYQHRHRDPSAAVRNEPLAASAVCVKNASKGYGIGKRRSNVLQSLNMIVETGTM